MARQSAPRDSAEERVPLPWPRDGRVQGGGLFLRLEAAINHWPLQSAFRVSVNESPTLQSEHVLEVVEGFGLSTIAYRLGRKVRWLEYRLSSVLHEEPY